MLKVNIQIFNGSITNGSFAIAIHLRLSSTFVYSILRKILLEKGLIAWLPFFFLEFESSIMYFIVFNRLIQNLCAIADLIVNKIHNNQIDIYISKSV